MPDTTMAAAAIPGQRIAPPAAPAPASPAPQTLFPLAHHWQAVVDEGRHPATGAELHPDPAATCSSCVHAVLRVLAADKTRTRCALSPSRRGGPDLVPTMPGCTRHRTKDTTP